MIDTHCHLYLSEFEEDIDSVISHAIEVGVQKMYLPAINSETHEQMLLLEAKYPDRCISMMGLHPCYVKENYVEELLKVEKYLKSRNFAAIGECGLDFYWDNTYAHQQYLVLEQQIEWAKQYNIPIILHTRNATKETIAVVEKNKSSQLKGIFHCFGGTIEEANQIIAMGFYLGIGGVVTYKNAGLDLVLKEIDLKHIVLETDAPYLAPVPFRGKRNESKHVKVIAEKIAEIKNCSFEEVVKITDENARMIFAG